MRKPETHILRQILTAAERRRAKDLRALARLPGSRVCCILGCHSPATIKRLSVPSLLDESLGASIQTLYYCSAHVPPEKEKQL